MGTTTLTPERIAALRAKNAQRATTDWPTRYLVDELLDCIEQQQAEIERNLEFYSELLCHIDEQRQEIERLRRALEAITADGYGDGDDLFNFSVTVRMRNAARAALRGEGPDA